MKIVVFKQTHWSDSNSVITCINLIHKNRSLWCWFRHGVYSFNNSRKAKINKFFLRYANIGNFT